MPVVNQQRLCGIYAIWRSGSEQCYVGSSHNITHRWTSHLSELRHNKHHSARLQNSWNKYGEQAFCFAVLECCEPDRLFEREQYFVDALRPEFNMSLVADCPWRGQSPSAETRAKMAAAKVGIKQTPEVVAKRVASRDGYKHSAETKAKISQAHAGRTRGPLSAGTRAKLSIALTLYRALVKKAA